MGQRVDKNNRNVAKKKKKKKKYIKQERQSK